ncbi:hypothetical protein BST11_08930 [Mycobacterium alsense]|uniref:Integrase n=1 Tax=Mycobacterium alsense TaxID=324058 RepID=A0ABX3RBL6_9MYCO|nr:hypothetical protein BST11_08930 [Mycobacterium alsense]
MALSNLESVCSRSRRPQLGRRKQVDRERHRRCRLGRASATGRFRTEARLGHANAVETLDTYSHLWPDSDDRTRDAIDSVPGSSAGDRAADQLRTVERRTP